MSNIALPYTQIIDPSSFKSILNAKIYIGEYGVLPNPSNSATWKQAYFVQDDGTRVAASQPIRTNAAGFAVDGSGNIRTVQVDGQYSIIVQDSLSVQKYSNTRINEFSTSEALTVDIITTVNATGLPDGIVIIAKGRSAVGDGGGGVFRYSASSTQTADNVLVFAPASGAGRIFRDGWTVNGFNDPINVKWAGAKGDWNGTTGTDDSTAITLALTVARGVFGTGRTVFFPDGKYLCGDIDILTTGMTLLGESKYGTWLVAKTGSTHIIDIGSLATPAREVTIEKLSFDYTNLASHTDNAAIRFKNSYGNSLRDVLVNSDNDNTSASWGIYYGQGTYTTHTDNVSCKRIRIYSPTADRPTTLTFTSVDFGLVDIDNAGAITFIQPIGQSSVARSYGSYRVKVVNCFSFTAIGGDYEDDDATHFIYFFDNVTQHLVSIGNWTTGFAGGYAAYGGTGIPSTCKTFLQDHKTDPFEYRSGSWTPSLAWATPGTSTITYGATRFGSFIKKGRECTCTFAIDDATFNNGTASGFLVLSGLPFPAATKATDSYGGAITKQIGYPTSLQSVIVLTGTSTAAFSKADGLGGSIVVADVSGSGKYLRATFTYETVS